MKSPTQQRLAVVSVIVLAVAASAAGVTNGFAFDDIHIVAANDSVHSLSRWWELFASSYWPPEKGGDLYRPVTMLGYAIQWALGGGSPLAFHIWSILLYALVCAAFFHVAAAILPLGAAWLAAALFAVHPLHVEAVGNVVGQSELWSALFMLVALAVYLRARQQGPLTLARTGAIAALYCLAFLSKEHGLVLPLLLLAAEITLVPRTQPLRARIAGMRTLMVVMTAVGFAFLWVRMTVLAKTSAGGAQVSMIFGDESFGIRAMTMLRVVPEWVRLFVWPAHLSASYSPRHIDVATGPSLEMLPSVAILIGVAWLAWLARRAAPVATFAVLWVAVAMIFPSNILVPTGFVLAERTLFLGSGGVMLGIAAGVAYFAARDVARRRLRRNVAFSTIALVLVLGLVASAGRQGVWRDNSTLFTQTVKDAPTSYTARLNYASVLFERRQVREGFEQLSMAHSLYPRDMAVLEFAGEQYAEARSCVVAARLFRTVLANDPRRVRSRAGLARCLIIVGDHANARRVIREGLASGDSDEALGPLLLVNDSVEASGRVPPPRAAGAPRRD
ncbi:MAG TPA: hypothetical protein VNO75_01700 [Gemmatimonadaceae bacterium]|nr:hypothetical protein [Gemmatimonadaceae bacterium]